MDNHVFYDSDYGTRPPKRDGGRTFSIIVIVIVVILLIAMVAGLFWPRLFGQNQQMEATPAPTGEGATAQPQLPGGFDWPEGFQWPVESPKPTVTPVPTPTPVVSDEDRKMPALDGVLPNLPGMVDNPIPDIFDAAAPGVVGILNYNTDQTGKLSLYGSGTGFFISSDGYIITNAHVIESASKVTVLLDSGEEEDAQVIGKDEEIDICVLKISKSGMPALSLGDSDQVRVGEYVLAIGNPLDADKLANTLTFGIVSALAREITIDNYTNTYLQTDAAINFGNSGGPLLNMQGQVIGVNSAKTITAGYDAFGNAVNAEGIGFALPINQVKTVLSSLITKGKVERPGIGIVVGTVTETLAKEENLPLGAYVQSVVKGSPSAKAGLKAGDVITEANGTLITQQTELIELVKAMRIGDSLTVKVYRDGSYLELVITTENKSDMDFNNVEE